MDTEINMTAAPEQRRAATRGTMDVVRRLLRAAGRIRKGYRSPEPVERPTHWAETLIVPLLDRRNRKIGTVRVFVRVANYGSDATVRIDWQRVAFGFWFSRTVAVPGAAEDPETASYAAVRRAIGEIGQTAEGAVPLQSMIEIIPTLKRHETPDRSLRQGLRAEA